MAALFRPYKDAGKRRCLGSGSAGETMIICTWEDAIDLYNGFEWKESAQCFLGLANMIADVRRKAQCHLNAAIIFARTDKHREAAAALEEVSAPEDSTLALTLFLMGHVYYELAELERSEQCFRIALDQLDGRSARFADLDFLLEPSQIKLNLAVMAKNTVPLAAGVKPVALPADGVLKPASRPSMSDRSFLRNSQSSVPALDFSPPNSPAGSSFSAEQILSGQHRTHTRIESVEYSSGDLKYHNIDRESEVGDQLRNSRSVPALKSLGTMVRRISYRRPTKLPVQIQEEPNTLPPIRIRVGHAARDARGDGHSMRDLAQFIRRLPQRIGDTAERDDEIEPPSPLDTAEARGRCSGSDAPPSLTDRESISDGSIHSSSHQSHSNRGSAEVIIHHGGEAPESDFAVPPPKNPSRQIVAMERAHKILAERSINPLSPSLPPPVPPRRPNRTSRQDLVEATLTAVQTSSLSIPDVPPPRARPAQGQLSTLSLDSSSSRRISTHAEFQRSSLTALPPLPGPPARLRPDLQRQGSHRTQKHLPSLPEQSECHHRLGNTSEVELQYFVETFPPSELSIGPDDARANWI